VQSEPTRSGRRWLQLVFPLIVLIVLFGFVLPQLIDYAAVWEAITSLSIEAVLILAGMGIAGSWAEAGIYTSLIPGLGFGPGWRAFLGGNTVAGFAPSPWDIVVRYAMYRGFGVEGSVAGASVIVGGGFQVAIAILAPLAFLVVLVTSGQGTETARTVTALAIAAAVGAIVVISLILRRESLAASIGRMLQRAADRVLPWFKREPPPDLETSTVQFRALLVGTLATRWGLSAFFLFLSHTIKYLGMLFLFRQLGIGADVVSALELAGVYAVGMFMALMPIVPAGLGAVELTYIWILARDDPELADLVAAATFSHRVFFWLLPILIGIGPLVSWIRGGGSLSGLETEQSFESLTSSSDDQEGIP